MRKVTLKKLKKTEVQVLQLHIAEFANHLGKTMIINDLASFLDSMAALDISGTLWFMLRAKIENETVLSTLNLSVSQAATLAKSCDFVAENTDDYCKNLLLKISSSIDQQLKSMT